MKYMEKAILSMSLIEKIKFGEEITDKIINYKVLEKSEIAKSKLKQFLKEKCIIYF